MTLRARKELWAVILAALFMTVVLFFLPTCALWLIDNVPQGIDLLQKLLQDLTPQLF